MLGYGRRDDIGLHFIIPLNTQLLRKEVKRRFSSQNNEGDAESSKHVKFGAELS